jgi:hypothetical protein
MNDSDWQSTSSESPDSAASDPSPDDPRSLFEGDKFYFNQKLIAINAKYHVFNEAGAPVLFVERPAHLGRHFLIWMVVIAIVTLGIVLTACLAALVGPEFSGVCFLGGALLTVIGAIFAFIRLLPRRNVNVYRDESRQEHLLAVFQDKKFEWIVATYTVVDAAEGVIGSFRKNFLWNILRRRWQVLDPEGNEIVLAMEDSLILSIVRRVLQQYVGFMPLTNFVFFNSGGKRTLGVFNRKYTFRDRYVLDLTQDPERTFDRRLAVAIGVMLDTGECR